ncbi:MAG: hypothetical protein AABY22_35605 [Nanoarchaeota archaeon]
MSAGRHDFVSCDCTNENGIAIDGGKSYLRIIGNNVPRQVNIKVGFDPRRD